MFKKIMNKTILAASIFMMANYAFEVKGESFQNFNITSWTATNGEAQSPLKGL